MMTMDGLARDCGQFTMIHDSNCNPTEWNQTVTNSNAAHWRWARELTRSIKVQFWICFVFFRSSRTITALGVGGGHMGFRRTYYDCSKSAFQPV